MPNVKLVIILFAPLLAYLSFKKPLLFPFGLFVFLLPFDSILVLGEEFKGPTITKFLGAASIFVLFVVGLFSRRLKVPGKPVIYWGLFVAFAILSINWAIMPEEMTDRIPTAIGLFLLYLSIASYRVSEKEFNMIKNLILWGGLLTAAYMLISYYFFGLSYREHTLRASIFLGEHEASPNHLARDLLMPLSISIAAIISSKNTINWIMNWAFSGLILFGILLTSSRSGAIAAAVVIGTFVFGRQKKLYPLILVPLTILLAAQYLPEVFFSRMSQLYEMGLGSRGDIWKVGFEALKHNWLLGVGLDNFPFIYDQFLEAAGFQGYGRAAHNIFLGFAVELGVVGILLLLVAIYKHFILIKRRPDKEDKVPIMLRAALFGMLISCLAQDALWRKSFWLIWMLIMMYNNIETEKQLDK